MCSTRTKDYVSALPDEILCHILSLLPMKSAVQTSLLSNGWRHLWKYNSVLQFTYLPYHYFTPADYAFIKWYIDQCQAFNVICFSVKGVVNRNATPPLDIWIDFVVSKNVKVLMLDLDTVGMVYLEMPSSLYCANSIEVLKLSSVNLSPPISDIRFSLLKDLTLVNCLVNDEVVRKFMSNCQLLETMSLTFCSGLDKVNLTTLNQSLHTICIGQNPCDGGSELVVSVPHLKYIKYFGPLIPIHLNKFKGTADLTSIHFYGPFAENLEKSRLLLNELADLKVLMVDHWFVHLLASEQYGCSEFNWRSRPFNNLEMFCLFGYLRSDTDILALVNFLGKCPSLRDINLNFCYGLKQRYYEDSDRERELRIGTLHQVRRISVSYYAGHKCEMELLKLLLLKSDMLVTLHVSFRDPKTGSRPSESAVKLLKEQICLMKRTAPRCEILFDCA